MLYYTVQCLHTRTPPPSSDNPQPPPPPPTSLQPLSSIHMNTVTSVCGLQIAHRYELNPQGK